MIISLFFTIFQPILLDYVAIYRIQKLMEMIHRCGSTKSRKEVQVHTVVRFKEPKNIK
jgi:hypothetical protein